jgi:hypothetical protein
MGNYSVSTIKRSADSERFDAIIFLSLKSAKSKHHWYQNALEKLGPFSVSYTS